MRPAELLALALLLTGCAAPVVPVPGEAPAAGQTFTALATGDHSSMSYGPYRLVHDSHDHIWVMYAGSNKLAELSPDGQLLQVATPGTPHTAIAIDAQDRLWLLDDANQLEHVDLHGQLVASYPVDERPAALAVDGLGQVWVTSYARRSLCAYDAEGKRGETRTFQDMPIYLAPGPKGLLWLLTQADDHTWHAEKPATGERFPFPAAPYGVAAASDGGLWLTDEQGVLHRLAADGSEVGKLALGGVLYGLACTAAGTLWLTGPDNHLTAIDDDLIPTASVPVGGNPGALTIDGRGRVWVLNQLDGTVTRVEPS